MNFVIIAAIAAVGLLVYQLLREFKRSREEKKDDQSFVMIQQYLGKLEEKFEKGMKAQDKTLNEQLKTSQDALSKHFVISSRIAKEANEGIKNLTENLTEMKETNKQIAGFADQLKTLENTLRNPKQRGILGEMFLENLLSNVLPPSSFQMQYSFKSGEVVDAIIRVNDKLIPVDAKFSLENYNKIMEEKDDAVRDGLQKDFKNDLKKRIDETSKYVRPQEGTVDFAFMFIPADGVFYNLLTHKVGAIDVNTSDLIDYAFKKHVILVSPMTFYAYLQTVMHALRALVIEEKAVEIQKRVGDLGRHLNAYQDYFKKLGTHLGTTVSTYNNAGKELGKIDKDVVKITGDKAGGPMELPPVDHPQAFEEVSVKLGEPKPKQRALDL
ncbi:MAG: DNA recombination protein RmuC [Candidatus Peregrinibacteria bacterium]